jgi:hypothetical protein
MSNDRVGTNVIRTKTSKIWRFPSAMLYSHNCKRENQVR